MASSSSTTSRWEYQVFLSFRGEDTRKNFTDHLYTALLNAGYHTFRDDDELERGEDIASNLERAIRQSQMSIVVFSKDYASSRWCLDELVYILLQRKRSSNNIVLPVFYHVDPSDVRKQTGIFAEAFALHEKRFAADMDRVEGWRAALREAADLAGMSLQNQANGHEAQFIQNIIKEVGRKLNRTILNVGPHVIGTDDCVEAINSWLQDGSTDVGIGAICGMGGIGKTTIAKIVYNQNFNNFEGCSFLANIREMSEQPNGLVRLQRQLLSDILKGKKIKIYNVDEGIIKIENALSCKRVLLVLDDIDQLDQLNAILGMRTWFYPGSKIIITTRHARFLHAHEACEIFNVRELNEDESLELFSWHAFGQDHPVEAYLAHSRSIVQYCGGIPLALKVLGSSLYDNSVHVWESATQKLKAIPDNQILKILKISYDSLQDDHDKNLFLDIACFFVGKNKDYTTTILDGCDFYTIVGIQNLLDRSLIEIDVNHDLQMHQLLQEMGRGIVYRESPMNPGKQSRLWNHKDAFSVLRNKMGSEAIEGLMLKFHMLIEDMPNKAISCENNAKRRPFQDILGKWTPFYDTDCSAKRRRLGFSSHPVNTCSQKSFSMQTMGELSTEAFAMMHRLRLLSLNYVQLSGGYKNFPKDIRWLCWHGFPMESIPTNFCLENLVVLEMRHSYLTHLWKGTKFLVKLKILDLNYSHGLIRTPDVSGLPCLERLMLKDCISLVEVHESIGDLKCLVFLSLKGCKNLRKLPQNFGNLISLQEINLSGCSKLEFVKSESCQLRRSMWSLISRRQHPEVIHFSMASLPRCLVKLILSKSSLTAIPDDICTKTVLRYLDLHGTPIYSLPDRLKHLTMLEFLNVGDCLNLQSLPEFPTSLRSMTARNCTSLERLPTIIPNLSKTSCWDLEGCNNLVEAQGIFKLEPIGNIDTKIASSLRLFDFESLGNINMKMYNKRTATSLKMPLQVLYESGIASIFRSGSEVPNWYSYKNIGSRISFKVPLLLNQKIRGMNVCAIYGNEGTRNYDSYEWNIIRVRNVTKSCRWDYNPACYGVPEKLKEDMIWLSHWKFKGDELKGGDEVIVSFFMGCKLSGYNFLEKKIGMHLVYEEEEEEQTQELNGESITKRGISPTWFQNITDCYQPKSKEVMWHWGDVAGIELYGINFKNVEVTECELSDHDSNIFEEYRDEAYEENENSGDEAYEDYENSGDESISHFWLPLENGS